MLSFIGSVSTPAPVVELKDTRFAPDTAYSVRSAVPVRVKFTVRASTAPVSRSMLKAIVSPFSSPVRSELPALTIRRGVSSSRIVTV